MKTDIQFTVKHSTNTKQGREDNRKLMHSVSTKDVIHNNFLICKQIYIYAPCKNSGNFLFLISYLLPVTVICNGRNMLQYRNTANNKKIISMLCFLY